MKNINKFFETLGEIWRDITVIEFLMRCALAQKKGDISKLPKPPYAKGRIYQEYPESFSPKYFSEVVKKFNNQFPKIAIPLELVELRNAMAHGVIAEINHKGIDELVKFKKQEDNDTLKIEFGMPLDQQRIDGIRISLRNLRRHIANEATDK